VPAARETTRKKLSPQAKKPATGAPTCDRRRAPYTDPETARPVQHSVIARKPGRRQAQMRRTPARPGRDARSGRLPAAGLGVLMARPVARGAETGRARRRPRAERRRRRRKRASRAGGLRCRPCVGERRAGVIHAGTPSCRHASKQVSAAGHTRTPPRRRAGITRRCTEERVEEMDRVFPPSR
jgi:hypothetical protein